MTAAPTTWGPSPGPGTRLHPGARDRDGASSPTEHRGLARDEVRLVVARPDRVETTVFRALPAQLSPGDLVVVNTSATVPAALDGWVDGRAVVVHLSSPLDDGTWVVELRRPDRRGPVLDARPADVVVVAGGAVVRLLTHRARAGDGVRLWVATIELPPHLRDVRHLLAAHGRPIAYAHLTRPPSLAEVQPAVARVPGSAEMASAGRPVTPRVVTDLVTAGVVVAPIVLHAGVSSQTAGEPPQPERFVVPAPTAGLVEHTRASGGRVVAIGTTVVRALESAVDAAGVVRAWRGWTDRLVTVDDPPQVVTGLVTGWHEPDSTHQLLLEAVAGRALVEAATAEADAGGLLWHEFGDSCLLLP